MTTPERLRFRQRIEGTLLIILGVFTVIATMYLNNKANDQRECTVTVVSDFIDSVDAGREANAVEQEATRRLILNAFSGKLKTEADVAAARDRYRGSVDTAQKMRSTAPLPPDPEKVCQ